VQYKFKHKFAVVDLQIFDLPDTEELQNAWVTFSNTGTKQVRVAVCSLSRALSFTFAKITSGFDCTVADINCMFLRSTLPCLPSRLMSSASGSPRFGMQSPRNKRRCARGLAKRVVQAHR
jgi:hypothetical protein